MTLLTKKSDKYILDFYIIFILDTKDIVKKNGRNKVRHVSWETWAGLKVSVVSLVKQ